MLQVPEHYHGPIWPGKIVFGIVEFGPAWYINLPGFPDQIFQVRVCPPEYHGLVIGLMDIPHGIHNQQQGFPATGFPTGKYFLFTGREEIYLESRLGQLVDYEYDIVGLQAGFRPTVTDRRPLLGRSGLHPSIFIFNGLGTKGVSLAAYFSKHLLEHLENSTDLIPEADLGRFST